MQAGENPAPEWVDARMWSEVQAVAGLSAFKGLAESFAGPLLQDFKVMLSTCYSTPHAFFFLSRRRAKHIQYRTGSTPTTIPWFSPSSFWIFFMSDQRLSSCCMWSDGTQKNNEVGTKDRRTSYIGFLFCVSLGCLLSGNVCE